MLPADLASTVARALAEDLGSGDLSAALIPAQGQLQAHIISREAGILCGQPYVNECLRQVDPNITIHWLHSEGSIIEAQQELCRLEGPAAALLTAERTALNFLQTLSGTATLTRRYVEALTGTPTQLLDTRKTLPGLRMAQKYAVRMGGGRNHRLGLFDGILIKENHIAAIGSITKAIARARALAPVLSKIEVEVETLEQLEEVLAVGVDLILLDNFTIEQLQQAVRRVAGTIPLEASGNVRLETIRTIAETGVDFVSVGSLTRNLQSLDLSLRYL